MASKITNLLAQRRFNTMEMIQERDPVAKEALRAHIVQLDADIMQLIYDDEVTQVIPRESMRELVYGGES